MSQNSRISGHPLRRTIVCPARRRNRPARPRAPRQPHRAHAGSLRRGRRHRRLRLAHPAHRPGAGGRLGRRRSPSPPRTARPRSPSPSPPCSRRISIRSPIPRSMTHGNIYVTFSGSRGQSVPTSLFRIDDESTLHPLDAEIMNPTGLALDNDGNLYISSRHDGAVYRLSTSGDLSTYAEGMGVATGLAFDRARQSLRRRPQRHHLQNRARPPDLRLCHPRTQRRRLSSGLFAQRKSLRHRPHHVLQRLRL